MLYDNLLIDSLADVEPWGSKAGELGGMEVVLDPWPPHHPLPVMGRLNSLCQDHVPCILIPVSEAGVTHQRSEAMRTAQVPKPSTLAFTGGYSASTLPESVEFLLKH